MPRSHYPGEIQKPKASRSNLSVTTMKLLKNALQSGDVWKRRLFVFVWTEEILSENGACRKRCNNVIAMTENSSGVLWTEKNLMRFQSEIDVFKFLRRSVDGKKSDSFSEWKPTFSNPSSVVWTGGALLTVIERNYLIAILTFLFVFWQRLTCCVSLLLSFLCINIAWYRPKSQVLLWSHNSARHN